MKEWAGLRPGRPQVRLERDHIRDKYGNTLEVCIRKDALVRHKFPSCNYWFLVIISSLSLLALPYIVGSLKESRRY
jgi:hypothetical protein